MKGDTRSKSSLPASMLLISAKVELICGRNSYIPVSQIILPISTNRLTQEINWFRSKQNVGFAFFFRNKL